MASSSSSSSLPSSASSTRIRYFDLLPPELLTYVLNHLDASPRHDAKIRQKTLYSLCLTSKLLHELAQPFLLKHIQTSIGAGDNMVKSLITNNGDETIAKVQSFHFDTPHLDNKQRWIVKIAQRAINLRTLYVSGLSPTLEAFNGNNITTLSLKDVSFLPGAPPLAFPELTRLSLTHGFIFNNSVTIPKLKHFALNGRVGMLQNTELELITPSLASFTTSLRTLPYLPPSIFAASSPLILFENSSSRYALPQTALKLGKIKHLCLTFGKDWHLLSSDSLDAWTEWIRKSPHQIETVYLASHAGGGGAASHCLMNTQMVLDFTSVCVKQKIEVFWEVRDDTFTFDNSVPASFIKKSEARQASNQSV